MSVPAVPPPAAAALRIDPATIDALGPGDRAVLRRHIPAAPGSSTSRTYGVELTIAVLERHELADRTAWYLEGREDATRGCWWVGEHPSGMVTTLEAASPVEVKTAAGQPGRLAEVPTLPRWARPVETATPDAALL